VATCMLALHVAAVTSSTGLLTARVSCLFRHAIGLMPLPWLGDTSLASHGDGVVLKSIACLRRQVVSFLLLACLVLSASPASADRNRGRNRGDGNSKPPFTGRMSSSFAAVAVPCAVCMVCNEDSRHCNGMMCREMTALVLVCSTQQCADDCWRRGGDRGSGAARC
jgi:hypothetical protein